jgi:RNA polymerase sigma-70 factor (ECF subfamily)
VELPLDDGQLLRRCRQGDPCALAELIRRYEGRLYRVAFRAVGDRALAEEAAVDSFYKIWCKASQWRGETSPEAWIYRIAVRTTLDLQRSRQRWWRRKRLASSTTEEDPSRGPADTIIAEEERQRAGRDLKRAVDELKEEDRLLVHLYYFEGQSLAEVAVILDASRDALKMRLARARRQLREFLEESGGNFQPQSVGR